MSVLSANLTTESASSASSASSPVSSSVSASSSVLPIETHVSTGVLTPSETYDQFGISRSYHDSMIREGYSRYEMPGMFPCYMSNIPINGTNLRRSTTTWFIGHERR